MVEVVGTSNTSFSDAVRAAVHRAGETLDDLGWFEVKEMRGRIAEGNITEFQVKVELGFRLHATADHTHTHAPARREGTRQARSAAAQTQAAAARKQSAKVQGERPASARKRAR